MTVSPITLSLPPPRTVKQPQARSINEQTKSCNCLVGVPAARDEHAP